MAVTRIGLVAVALLATGSVGTAQDAPPPKSWKEEAERLQREIDELKRSMAAHPGEAEAPVSSKSRNDPDATRQLEDDKARDLDDLLGKQHPGTDFGGFGIRLTEYGVQPYIHGYVTDDYLATRNIPFGRDASGAKISLENSFFLSEFAVMVGANIKDTVIPEVQLVYETGNSASGADPEAIHLRYGQVDIHLHDLLTFRVGKFLVPFGRYNESLYPEFLFPISRFLLRSFQTIVPVVWADTGVQVRGRYRVYEGLELNYTAWVVNGLRETNTSTVPGVVSDGGSIPAMRSNSDIALSNGLKTWGGRLGVKALGADAGVSVAGGPYTVDSKQYLYFGGYYFYFQWRGFSLGTEGVLCLEQRTRPNHDLHQRGGFVYVAYRFYEVPIPWTDRGIDIEPVVAVDYTNVDQRQQNTRLYMAGVQFYFLPKDLPNAKLSFTGGALDTFTTSRTIDLFLITLSVAF